MTLKEYTHFISKILINLSTQGFYIVSKININSIGVRNLNLKFVLNLSNSL